MHWNLSKQSVNDFKPGDYLTDSGKGFHIKLALYKKGCTYTTLFWGGVEKIQFINRGAPEY